MSKKRVRKTADDYNRQGWSICPVTRLLIYKPPFNRDQSYEKTFFKVKGNKELEVIYVTLGIKMWNSVGVNDLFDKAYLEIFNFASENLNLKKNLQLLVNLGSIRKRKTKPETLKLQGWSICPKTELLSYKPIDKSCDITYISDFDEDKELQIVYAVLAIDLWGTVGLFDLLYEHC